MTRTNIKGSENLVRDNGAIINTDKEEYEKRLKVIQRNKSIDSMAKRIDDMEEKLDTVMDKIQSLPEILEVLKRLADK